MSLGRKLFGGAVGLAITFATGCATVADSDIDRLLKRIKLPSPSMVQDVASMGMGCPVWESIPISHSYMGRFCQLSGDPTSLAMLLSAAAAVDPSTTRVTFGAAATGALPELVGAKGATAAAAAPAVPVVPCGASAAAGC